MNILNELHKPHCVDDLQEPLALKHFWAFNAKMLDFYLAEIKYIEETTGPVVVLRVADSEIYVPSSWNIMVTDTETYTIDFIPIVHCAAFDHLAMIFSPVDNKLITEKVSIVELKNDVSCIYPQVEKGEALIHSISPGLFHGREIPRGIIIGPNELWRHINGCTVGDIL